MVDLLIRDAVVWTDGRVLDADAVAVTDGVISAIGDGDELAAAGAERIIDAAGSLLTPAFADTHIHASWGGFEVQHCDLTGCFNAEECLAVIGDYAATHPDIGWIRGGGWSKTCFSGGNPRREDLDAIVPDRPVFLFNRDHHGAWANTRALAIAGVGPETPDPFDGRIERDLGGVPTGSLHEGAAGLVGRVAPPITDEDLRAALDMAQARLFGMGITAWHEAVVGGYGGYPDAGEAYATAVSTGRVKGRVTGAVWVPRGQTPDRVADTAAALIARRDELGKQGFTITAAKIMVDGVPETRTAAMHDDYEGFEGDTGLAHFDRDTLVALVPLLNAAGIDMHAHAIGDRAVTWALDAVEAVPPEDRRGRHNNIAHIQFVQPSDVPRFAELGVITNAQPLWARRDMQMLTLCAPLVGEERMGWQYPFESIRRAGGTLAFGSDWPISTPYPWETLEVAVTRRHPGDHRGEPLDAAEAITVHEALLAYTRHAHDLVGSPAGSLTVGAPADLTVADRNPLAAPHHRLHATRVALTVLGGEIVHEAR